MIRLFCSTGGAVNDLLSSLISRITPPVLLGPAKGILGTYDAQDLDRIAAKLNADGYYVFDEKLPEEVCLRLTRYALNTECNVRVTDQGVASGGRPELAKYDPIHPKGVRYEFSQQQVINIPEVQGILADLSVLAVAQAYLGSTPVADVSGMWWHTAFMSQPDREAAQYFHFDLDRIKWLKFFFYISDVTTESGPHCFVAGSHKTNGIPRDLLSRGYARLEDADVAKYFPADALKEFVAPRGTIIAEDTRGLHKGKHVLRGDRLMLQLQFSNSLFGTTYAPTCFERVANESLAFRVKAYPRIYRYFTRMSQERIL